MNSKSKLKFRSIDGVQLTRALEQALQFTSKMEELCAENNVSDPSNLPPSILASSVLYDICCGYEIMYNRLAEYELLVAGYPKQTHSQH